MNGYEISEPSESIDTTTSGGRLGLRTRGARGGRPKPVDPLPPPQLHILPLYVKLELTYIPCQGTINR